MSERLKGTLNEGVIIYYQGEEAEIDTMDINSDGQLIVKLVSGKSVNLGRVNGYSVSSVNKISGTSMAGSRDKYGIYLNDASSTKIGEFTVINGMDGVGAHFYKGTISGDGNTTDFLFEHNLSTFDVNVTVYDSITKEDVIVDVVRIDENTIRISFEKAPIIYEQYSVFIMTMK